MESNKFKMYDYLLILKYDYLLMKELNNFCKINF